MLDRPDPIFRGCLKAPNRVSGARLLTSNTVYAEKLGISTRKGNSIKSTETTVHDINHSKITKTEMVLYTVGIFCICYFTVI